MENASGAGKKTIQPQDVLVALKDSEFEFMIPRIEAELKSTFEYLFSCFLIFLVFLTYLCFVSFLIISFANFATRKKGKQEAPICHAAHALLCPSLLPSPSFMTSRLRLAFPNLPPNTHNPLIHTPFPYPLHLTSPLAEYNTVQCDKRNTYRRKVKADKAATTSTNPNAATDPDTTLNTAENSTVTSPAADDADAETALSASAAAANGGTRDDDRPAKKMRFDGEEGDDEEDVDDGAEDPAEDDEGEIDEDEEMEEEEDDDENDEDVEDEGEDENGAEGDEERIQRQIERDEALDEGGESD